MRIHSNILRASAVRDALDAEKKAGRIPEHVMFKSLQEHGSRATEYASEIQLEAGRRDHGRRAGNSGSYGAMRPEIDGYAATYDEWGWLLAALFRLDPKMIVGTPKSPVYADVESFNHRTALTYAPEILAPMLERGEDPYPIVVGNAARTKRGYFVGRHGASRVDSQPSYWPGKVLPRNAADYRAFVAGETF
jgi:hypothetical protein